MTNLLEKALLIGFGIFILTIFFILVAPFFGKITDFKENDKRDLNDDNNNSIIIKFYENNENIENDEEIYFVNVEYLRYLEIFFKNNYNRSWIIIYITCRIIIVCCRYRIIISIEYI